MTYNATRGMAAIKAAGEHLRTKDAGDPFDTLAAKIGQMADTTAERLREVETKSAGATEAIADLEQRLARGDGGGTPLRPESWGEEFTKSQGEAIRALSESNRGRVALNVKATLTGGATSAGGLDVPARDATAMMPRRRLTIRDLLNVMQVESGTVEYAQQTDRTNAAATVAEGAGKPESGLAWELRTTSAKVIAHWVKASRQILEDAPMLRGMIDGELRYGLALTEEAQLLYGDGTGSNLSGLVTNATAFADPLSLASPTMIDMVGSAILQTALTDFAPDGVVVHPSDWMRMRMLKDADGKYLLGDPQSQVTPQLFGLPVVATQAMTVDKFLVGSFASAGTLYDRWQPRVEVGYENDDFTKNLVTVLAEERIALAVKWGDALTYGDFGNVV
ncbi:MAG: phage major capsid protein [Roseovarius sp.]|nr:phage major capsid protein [Roseovarius sp.]